MNLDFHGVISSYNFFVSAANFVLFHALEWSTKYIKIDLGSAGTVMRMILCHEPQASDVIHPSE
jgi:hypothetical protein